MLGETSHQIMANNSLMTDIISHCLILISHPHNLSLRLFSQRFNLGSYKFQSPNCLVMVRSSSHHYDIIYRYVSTNTASWTPGSIIHLLGLSSKCTYTRLYFVQPLINSLTLLIVHLPKIMLTATVFIHWRCLFSLWATVGQQHNSTLATSR